MEIQISYFWSHQGYCHQYHCETWPNCVAIAMLECLVRFPSALGEHGM
jgi:hypothetical protein